jgi:coenzyme Q-binding protein COQ10
MERPGLSLKLEPLMPNFETTHRVHHSADNMFALVADVESYPKFLPLCSALRIEKRIADEDGETLIARMTASYKLFSESFTTKVRLRPEKHLIMVDYLDGPFRKLENRWTFFPAGESACRIHFWLDYEFRSLPLQMLMGSVFDKAFRKFSTAFEDRADQIYRTPAQAERPASATG